MGGSISCPKQLTSCHWRCWKGCPRGSMFECRCKIVFELFCFDLHVPSFLHKGCLAVHLLQLDNFLLQTFVFLSCGFWGRWFVAVVLRVALPGRRPGFLALPLVGPTVRTTTLAIRGRGIAVVVGRMVFVALRMVAALAGRVRPLALAGRPRPVVASMC